MLGRAWQQPPARSQRSRARTGGILVKDIDRRALLRSGLAGGLAAIGGAGLLTGCDPASVPPDPAYGGTPTDPAATGSLILPGSPLVAAAERARYTTGQVRAHAVSLTEGMVDLGGTMVSTWSYGGTVPGPVIRVNKGDIVQAAVTNNVSQPTTVHWHGVALRNDMDGTMVTQQPVQPGASFTYRFTADE